MKRTRSKKSRDTVPLSVSKMESLSPAILQKNLAAEQKSVLLKTKLLQKCFVFSCRSSPSPQLQFNSHQSNSSPQHQYNSSPQHQFNSSPQQQFNSSPQHQSNSSPQQQFNSSPQHQFNSRHSPSPQAFRHCRNQLLFTLYRQRNNITFWKTSCISLSFPLVNTKNKWCLLCDHIIFWLALKVL